MIIRKFLKMTMHDATGNEFTGFIEHISLLSFVSFYFLFYFIYYYLIIIIIIIYYTIPNTLHFVLHGYLSIAFTDKKKTTAISVQHAAIGKQVIYYLLQSGFD
jgi:hypothetical protein